GFALILAWSVISIAHAHERTLARVNDFFTEVSMIMDQLDEINDDLNRLGIDQQAFLSTGEMRFQDAVIESAERLTIPTGMLKSLAASHQIQRPLLASLSRSVDQVVGLVGESDEIAAKHGGPAAVAFFETTEAEIYQAKQEAEDLRMETIGTI